MGRRRTHNTDLPRGMTEERGTFFFRGKDRKRINLGCDYPIAVIKYRRLRGDSVRCFTVHDVIERYRLEVLPLKPSKTTREDNARALTRLDRVFGHQLPDEITAPECYAYLDSRKNPKGEPAPVAARHEISLLGHVLGKSIRWGAGVANVVRTLEKIPKKTRDRYVEDAEFRACRSLANSRMKLFMDLARNIGQRRCGLLGIRREHITERGIEFKARKGGKGVLVKWTPTLRATVDELWKLAPQIPRDYLLRSRHGTPYTPRGFSSIWQRLMKKYVKSGGVRFTFHDLRAKAGSDKATIEEAQALLGHASKETTNRVYKRNLTVAEPVE